MVSKFLPSAGALALAAALSMPVVSGCFAHAGQEGSEHAEGTSEMGKRTPGRGGSDRAEAQEAEALLAQVDPRELEAARALAAKMATAVSDFINTTAMLASPRIMAKLETPPAREDLIRYVDEFLAVAGKGKSRSPSGGDGPLVDAEPHVRKLRELFGTWTPSRAVPPDIVAAARATLRAMGIPEPPEGWDRFEGASDSDHTPQGE